MNKVKINKKKKPIVKRRRNMLPFLSLIAQDGKPLKLFLDSDQEFSVMSKGQKHDVTISYTVLENKK